MGRRPQLSELCSDGLHDGCLHLIGWSIRLLPRPSKRTELCTCSCHAGCPLCGKRRAGEMAWQTTCTCPAGSEVRRIDSEVEARLAERQRWPVESDRPDDGGPSPAPPASSELSGQGWSSDAELPKFGRTAGICAGLAALAAAGAIVTGGIAEIALIVVAVLFALIAAWTALWAAEAARFQRLLRELPPSR